MLESIKQILAEYQAKYRRPDLPPLRLSGLYDLFPDEPRNVPVESGWNEKWPYSDDAGVYFIFGSGGQLLYIGKASMSRCIGGRLSNYFGTVRETRKCHVRHDWSEGPRYVATLAVPEEMRFEASALEEFLIARLKTADNTRGLRAIA